MTDVYPFAPQAPQQFLLGGGNERSDGLGQRRLATPRGRPPDLPPIFLGGVAQGPQFVPGAHSKSHMVAKRMGAMTGFAAAFLNAPSFTRAYPEAATKPQATFVNNDAAENADKDADKSFFRRSQHKADAAGLHAGWLHSRPQGTKSIPNAPTMQSVVDQVVFGRDMDFSGEDQFDEEYMAMFCQGAAGMRSDEFRGTQRGQRMFPNAPTMQSVVDQIVFGRDIDLSGEDQFDEEYLQGFRNSAGKITVDPAKEKAKKNAREAKLKYFYSTPRR